ncbi:MAG: hypothetical protein ACXABU_03545 [Candidatus Hodarchaeales archaeon]|jgi:hypothetical protein
MTQVTNLIIENPFHNFTARADVPEIFNLLRPNKDAINRISHALETVRKQKRESMIVPVIAEAGYGKTHFYWVVREQVTNAYVVYVPVPTNTNRIYSHFYFETVKAGGSALLEYVADFLVQKYKKVENAAFEFPGLGNVVIEGFFALKDPKQSKLALKWFTGFDIDEETKSFHRTIMDDEELAFAALKVILKSVDKPLIFFVDELESLFISLGPEAELQLLESIKKMHNEASNFVLCLACLATLWDKILDLSSTAVQSRIEPPILLKRFTKNDIQDYCVHMLKDFHQKFDLSLSEENSTWPLGKSDIESAYAYSHGNPREAIKWLAGVTEEKKAPILKELGKNQKFLSNHGKKIKSALGKPKGVTIGVLQRNNGLQISVSGKDNRYLIIIPPQIDLEPIFENSFIDGLKEDLAKENYSEVILLGEETPFKKNEMEVTSFSKDDIKGLTEYVEKKSKN